MSDKHYAVVIDTTQYAGNFHREMAAYMTGKPVDSYVGYEFARLANGKVKNKKWLNEHLIEKMDRYHDIPRCHYSDIFPRLHSELPTTHLYSIYSQYNGIIFFFDEMPPLVVIDELVERAIDFATNLHSIYKAAGKEYALTKQSFDFVSSYSNIRDTSKTLDIADVRFFEVSTASKLYAEKDPYVAVTHPEFMFMRTEESFMLEHNLKKALTEEEIQHYKTKFKKLPKKDKELVNAYFNNEVDIYKLRVNETMFLLYKIDYFTDNGLSMSELNSYYHEFNKTLEPMKGVCEITKNMYAIPHGNVQYVVKQVPKNYKIEDVVKKHNFIVENHHEKIKEVYDYLKSQNLKDIWVYGYVNGSIEATFGNSSGILAILELGEEKGFYDYMKPVKKNKIQNLIVSKKLETKYFNNHNLKDVRLKNKQH